ncbi:hypothetical protein [Nocardia jinanensis]|uniref:Uncharacterized protein n=1 Tax=Nocardia jinanensis TaxID=382504 RepID=A0A917VY00_9NOCA|nr:hypothetical protein [Nocardia jinanensis]GGL33512.1 hypothetical protein GCM10011588_55460 [Nocardia jinanensis]
MRDSLKDRIRDKLRRQLAEDGPMSGQPEDPRLIAVIADLDALDSVAEDDPLIEQLAGRYLVF